MQDLTSLFKNIIGTKNFTQQGTQEDYSKLQGMLGKDMSQKVMNNFVAFNGSGDSWENKLNKFLGNPEPSDKDKYYQANATLAYYKDALNEKLKAKNPKAFKDYFQGLVGLRRSGDAAAASKYIQDSSYNEYLTPDEIKQTLGEEGYNRYLSSLKQVNDYNISQKMKPLYGQVEGEKDISNLNYGRRFASLQVTPNFSAYNKTTGKNYSREYKFDPKTNKVVFTEGGDTSLASLYF